MNDLKKDSAQQVDMQYLLIAATFTAEPIKESLTFWMNELDISFQIDFAPYNQVFQQLLNPTSLLSRNQRGINVVLIRFEDWINSSIDQRDEKELHVNVRQQLKRNIYDLVQALQSTTYYSSSPYIVGICPASYQFTNDVQIMTIFKDMEAQLSADLKELTGVQLINCTPVIAAYPVLDYYDSRTDKLWHVPFTPLFFTALGTAVARILYTLKRSPRKVIVLDCDYTLWRGTCGEDGPLSIDIDIFRKGLQQFIIAQRDVGMLLCLCSKNNESDVAEVFQVRTDMLLTRSHIIAWRINWLPKSQNLEALAEELNLSLNSFIFIDDNPVECAEVQANCSEVLTLLLPKDAERIPLFLRHIWDFDHLQVTEEDQRRTSLYQQEKQRQSLRHKTLTLKHFLKDLNLEIQITEMEKSQTSRVAQLTQRTNQFNMTTIRRTEKEVQDISLQKGYTCLTVEVRDRFGDYGLVGVIVFTIEAGVVKVDTFLLSCRALGRGVEHQMLARLGKIAQEQKASYVSVPHITTTKNEPSLRFLMSINAQTKYINEKTCYFDFPAEYVATLLYVPSEEEETADQSKLRDQYIPSSQTAKPFSSKMQTISTRFNKIATELQNAEQIYEAIIAHRY